MRSIRDEQQMRRDDQFAYDMLTRIDAGSMWRLRKQVEMMLINESAQNAREGA